MKTLKIALALSALSFSGLVSAQNGTIKISNTTALPANEEMVEINASDIKLPAGSFVILDEAGKEVPYQLTHDSKIIFPATVGAGVSAIYNIKEGTPAFVAPTAYGRLVKERSDDMTWENDRCAYRAYGPALQARGEKAYGYDIWSKSVPYPVIEQRYYDDLVRKISFHDDHGNGLDGYAVGPTLGCGTDALIRKDGSLLMPYCWKEFELLDKGPLRFSVRLTYHTTAFDKDSVTETRVITLDKGSYLNKANISFAGLSKPAKVAQGIVVHSSNPQGYNLDKDAKTVAYEDFTDHPERDNGRIYVGVVSPDASDLSFMPIDEALQDVEGHVAAIGNIKPGNTFTYYFGSGWSKGGMPDMETWKKYLSDFSFRLANPLTVTVE